MATKYRAAIADIKHLQFSAAHLTRLTFSAVDIERLLKITRLAVTTHEVAQCRPTLRHGIA